MADISLPTGAFAAMKSGAPQPAAPTTEAKATEAQPSPLTTKTRKAPPERQAEPKISNSTGLQNKEPEEEAPPAGLTAAEKKIWRLKADGEEFDFDASDEESIKREIMKARGADKRFDSAAAMKKQAETFFEMIKNPQSLREVLSDPRVGVDLKKFASDYLWEQIQEEGMSPEQKAQRDKDRELEGYRSQQAKEKEAKESQERQARQAHFESSYEQKITKALDAGGIPKTHATVARMADYLAKALENGYDLTPEDLVQEVRNDYLNDFNSVLSAADGDQLLALIGDANAEKLRKADLKRLKSTQGVPFTQRSRLRPESAPAAQKRLGANEWKADLIKGFLARK